MALLLAGEASEGGKEWKEGVECLKEASSILSFVARDLADDPLGLTYLECNPEVARAVAQAMLAEAGFAMLEGAGARLSPESAARLACEVRGLFAAAFSILEPLRGEVNPAVLASLYARERLLLARSMRLTAAFKEGGEAEAMLYHAFNVIRHALTQIGPEVNKGEVAARRAELTAEGQLCDREFQRAKKANDLIFMTRTDCDPTKLLPEPSEVIKPPKPFEMPQPLFNFERRNE